MTCNTAIPLRGSWPLFEQSRHFDLGHILNSAITDALEPATIGALGSHHAGLFECNLADESLTWSGGVYDLFGLERGTALNRAMALAHYRPDSLVKLERLRSYAMSERLGFTLDVEIDAATVGERRWIRVIAAPACDGDGLIGLQGLKLGI